MKRKKLEVGKMLEHACILCANDCQLPFPDDCDENDCIKFIKK